MNRDGDDLDDLAIGRVGLDFGPATWVATAGALADHDGDGSVVNELPYREVSGPRGSRPMPSVRTRSAARPQRPWGEGARVVELDAETGTTVAWEAEVVDSEGREHEVLLDAAAKVVDVRPDRRVLGVVRWRDIRRCARARRMGPRTARAWTDYSRAR